MNNTQQTFGGRLRPKPEKPTWENLVDLSNEGMAFVYQRLSSHEQVKRSLYSIKAQDALEDLAKDDGYADDLIYTERRDLGISGTKGREDRVGLSHLIELVEAGKVEAVYVVHISRLYRDQTLINALSLGELFKEHDVIIVTPQMRLNLKDKMHMRLYRMEVERAADELELMANRLLGARDLKAKAGLYGGEILPPGIVVNELEKLSNGDPNPDYHGYQIFDPHAQVVKTIFDQLAIPGMTPTRVARYCRQKGITFPPFPPELDTPVNLKGVIRSRHNPDGGWPVTVNRVRATATNPAYIGWKFWGGELVGKDVYPPIIDEQLFWAVQGKFSGGESRPKKERDPLPLAGLLYCGNHDVPRPMSYANKEPAHRSAYQCYDYGLGAHCTTITAHILDVPISEAIIETLTLSKVADDVLREITDEYEAAKEQAASYRREKKRLETEVENLRGNLVTGLMGPDQLKWLDEQIQQRLAQIKELADLESRPVGAAVGRPMPGKEDIEMVKELLDTLSDKWDERPNGLKNALLRLLLDQVIIWHDTATIRVRPVWRAGSERELLIHRSDKRTREPWTETELEMLRAYYETASQGELVAILPGRTWKAIRTKGNQLELSREAKGGQVGWVGQGYLYTAEEDELVKRYYAGEMSRNEVMSLTGRTNESIKQRARKLRLAWEPRKATWDWLDDGRPISQGEHSPRPAPR